MADRRPRDDWEALDEELGRWLSIWLRAVAVGVAIGWMLREVIG